MATTVLDLWNNMVATGYKIRKNNLNGLDEWQSYKTKFATLTFSGKQKLRLDKNYKSFCEGLEYSAGNPDHTDAIINIGLSTLLDNTIEAHHFIVQHFRIPMLEDFNLSVVKLAQLAYNVGQAKAMFDYGAYSGSVCIFYRDNNLSEISTFIGPLFQYVPITQ